jgi:hypothetical protein
MSGKGEATVLKVISEWRNESNMRMILSVETHHQPMFNN